MHCFYDLCHHPDVEDEDAEVELDFQTLSKLLMLSLLYTFSSILGKEAKYIMELLENVFISLLNYFESNNLVKGATYCGKLPSKSIW